MTTLLYDDSYGDPCYEEDCEDNVCDRCGEIYSPLFDEKWEGIELYCEKCSHFIYVECAEIEEE